MLAAFFEFILHGFVEVVFYSLGEWLMYVFTRGKRKPRKLSSIPKTESPSDLSVMLGLIISMLILIGIILLLT